MLLIWLSIFDLRSAIGAMLGCLGRGPSGSSDEDNDLFVVSLFSELPK